MLAPIHESEYAESVNESSHDQNKKQVGRFKTSDETFQNVAHRNRTVSGRKLEDFEDLGEIGRGQFGSVHKVILRKRHPDAESTSKSSSTLVWKEFRYEGMSRNERRQLEIEVQVLERLNHPGIVRFEGKIHDEKSSILYMILEYCNGGDLNKFIQHTVRKGYRLPEDKIFIFFAQLTDALHYCHSQNILHRDLKPQNILLTGESFAVAKIADFGLAKLLSPQQRLTATQVGTPYYMSPELLSRQPYNTYSDLWSFGCVLFEMLTGSSPFAQATSIDHLRHLIYKHATRSITSLNLQPEIDTSTSATETASASASTSEKLTDGSDQSLKARLDATPYSSELKDIILRLLSLKPRARPTTETLRESLVFRLGCALHFAQNADRILERKKQADAVVQILNEKKRNYKRTISLQKTDITRLKAEAAEHKAVIEQQADRIRELEARSGQRPRSGRLRSESLTVCRRESEFAPIASDAQDHLRRVGGAARVGDQSSQGKSSRGLREAYISTEASAGVSAGVSAGASAEMSIETSAGDSAGNFFRGASEASGEASESGVPLDLALGKASGRIADREGARRNGSRPYSDRSNSKRDDRCPVSSSLALTGRSLMFAST